MATSVEYKIKCMALLSYPTLGDLAEYFHLTPIWSSEENIVDKSKSFHFTEKKQFDFCSLYDMPLDEQKCCGSCKHQCYLCRSFECVQTVDCAKAPCEKCGKVNNKCQYQQLRTSIFIFKNLLDVCHSENFSLFEQDKEFVFPQFPFCFTVELLWEYVNTAIESCLDFLMKTGFLNEDIVKDRLMDFRLIHKQPKQKLAVIFGDDLSEMFPELQNENMDTPTESDGIPLAPTISESSLSDNYYYNLENGKKVWLKKVLRKTFVLVDKFFDGAIFMCEEKAGNPIKVNFQVDGQGWEEINESSSNIEVINGSIKLTTCMWKTNHVYDVRVLLLQDNNKYTGIEYYGCTVKNRCSDYTDGELYKSWKFDELKQLVKMKDALHLEDIFNANKKLVFSLDGSKNGLLHWAAQYSSENTAKLLLQYGADPFAKNKEGATTFHQAANYNKVEIMKILVDHDCTGLNVQDFDLFTPLHYACLNNGYEMVKYLTDQEGINVDLKSKKGKKPDEVYIKTRDDIKKMIMICRAKS